MLCSHNTFTYMKPLKLWTWILIPTARCQKNNVKVQVKKGVEMFDIRVRFNKSTNRWHVCHGPSEYCTLNWVVGECYSYKVFKVRILIEGKHTPEQYKQLEDYLNLYKEIQFYEGRDKATWVQKLNLPSIEIHQYVGSVRSNYGKLFPWLYTKFNKVELALMRWCSYKKNSPIISLDFI